MNHNYTVKNDPLFQQMMIERNLKPESVRNYKKALQRYSEYNDMTLTELYTEADNEEEQGIRAKNRNIIKRLRGFRTWLIQNEFAPITTNHYYSSAKAFYRHYLIEVPYIPPIKLQTKQVLYEEIPHKKHIIEALQHTNNLKHIAIIYFMASSGTARNEVANITIQDFIDATRDYHNRSNINDVVTELESKDNIIPLFQLTRIKTGYRYYTCCTPEATTHIIRYLKSRPLKKLRPHQSLFDIKPSSITIFFERVSARCKYPLKFLHPHSLRKYHADIIGDWDLTNMLQGRKPNLVREAYFKQNPQRILKEYTKHIENLTLKPTRLVTIESNEVKDLKKHNKKLEEQILEDKQSINNLQEQINDILLDNEELGKALNNLLKKS